MWRAGTLKIGSGHDPSIHHIHAGGEGGMRLTDGDIVNGTYVHQRWSDLGDGTLVGLVDYVGTGIELAKALARRPASPEQSWVVTDSSTGKQFYFSPAKVAEMDAKEAERAA